MTSILDYIRLFVPYFCVAASAATLKQYELVVALIHAIVLVYLVVVRFGGSHRIITSIAVYSVLLTIACYLCIRVWNVFEFNTPMVVAPIPLWLPFTWAVVGLFTVEIAKFNRV